MVERFQVELDKSLSQLPNCFVWHPPDGIGPWRPGDWMFGSGTNWGVVEAKQCEGYIFPEHTWTPQQRQYAERIRRAGGLYWLVINFRRTGGERGIVLVYSGNVAMKILEIYNNLDCRSPHTRYMPLCALNWNGKVWGELGWLTR